MKKKLQKVIGVLSIMKDFNMKPNFSELERMYGIDRHTIKKYYENGGIPERKKFKKVSKWDNVIKLRNDEPSRYYCLDGVFIWKHDENCSIATTF